MMFKDKLSRVESQPSKFTIAEPIDLDEDEKAQLEEDERIAESRMN